MKKILLVVYKTIEDTFEKFYSIIEESESYELELFANDLKNTDGTFIFNTENAIYHLYPNHFRANEFMEVIAKSNVGLILLGNILKTMKKIAIQAYNNTDWLCDTDFIILTLTNKEIEEIKNIQKVLNENFPDYNAQVTLYNRNFNVYSDSMTRSYYSQELNNWFETPEDKKDDYIILTEDFDYDSLPDSETENDIRLDTTILLVNKNTILCKCYGKYDGSIEVYSDEININEL